jgi:hypothetical protein
MPWANLLIYPVFTHDLRVKLYGGEGHQRGRKRKAGKVLQNAGHVTALH